MADFLEFEQEEVTGQLRQLALAIRGLVDCFSENVVINDDVAVSVRGYLEQLKGPLEYLVQALREGGDIVVAVHQFRTDVLSVLKRFQHDQCPITLDEASFVRDSAVSLKSAVMARVVTRNDAPKRMSALAPSIQASVLAQDPATTTQSPPASARGSTVAAEHAPKTVTDEDDEYTVKLKTQGLTHRRPDGEVVALFSEALPPALDLSNLADLCQKLDAMDHDESVASKAAQAAASAPAFPSSAAAPATAPAPRAAPQPGIRRDVVVSGYNATMHANTLDQGFGQYLSPFAEFSKNLSRWIAGVTQDPQTLRAVLPQGKAALNGLVAQIKGVCNMSAAATFRLEDHAAELKQRFATLESIAASSQLDAKAVGEAVTRFPSLLFLIAAGIKETIALNVLIKRRSVFLGWRKAQQARPSITQQGSEDAVKKIVRVMVVGHLSVGKTSLIRRFCKATPFSETVVPTQGVEFRVYKVMLDGESIELQILDATGSRMLRDSFHEFYAVVEGVVIVYDISDTSSFGDIHLWMCDLQKYSFLEKIVVANKVDLEDKREVLSWRGQELAAEYNVAHVEVSCKTDLNVDEVFLNLVRNVKAAAPGNEVEGSASDDEGDNHTDLTINQPGLSKATGEQAKRKARDNAVGHIVKIDKYSFWTHP